LPPCSVDLLDPKDTTGTKVLANARLTGIATSVTAPDFTLNADLSIVVSTLSGLAVHHPDRWVCYVYVCKFLCS
jgi:hypothetical protein